ncbi:MAG: ATP-binding cassette domain-containing protein [Firmicutes bacterium]|nr:ATP-binding cassette domain-containing protein [Bacillota bacterium]
MLKNLAKKHKKKLHSLLFKFLGVAILIAAWATLSVILNNGFIIVPSPIATFRIIFGLLPTSDFWIGLSFTMLRALIAFILSFILASICAFLAYKSESFAKTLNPTMATLRAMPTIALVLILLLLVGSRYLAVTVAFLIIFPVCFEHLKSGLEVLNPQIIEMANAFEISKPRQLVHIYLPHMVPFIFSSAIAGFGLTFKVVIAAEILGLPALGIGHFMTIAQQQMEFATLFAWLVIAVLVSFFFEFLLRLGRYFSLAYKRERKANVKSCINDTSFLPLNLQQTVDKIQTEEIAFNNVNKSFDDIIVLEDFSARFEANKITAILAPSGAGKTTILNLIAKKLSADNGSLILPERSGYVFQDDRLVAQKTVFKNLELVLLDIVKDKSTRKEVVCRMLTLAGLEDSSNLYPNQLSGGMRRRVALLRALIYPAETLLLDEPFKGLDLKRKSAIIKEFLSLLSVTSRTTIFVTHDIDEALLIADNIYAYSDKPMKQRAIFSIKTSSLVRSLNTPELESIKKQIYECFEL